jgi:hypothetical protein
MASDAQGTVVKGKRRKRRRAGNSEWCVMLRSLPRAPAIRLSAKTLRYDSSGLRHLVLDGPFAETKG